MAGGIGALVGLQGALAGVRVADFTASWAGPHCVSLLAFMGAEVIKIESRSKLDLARYYPPYKDHLEHPDNAMWFAQMHRNSLSVTLNLRERVGVELAKRIVAISDIAAENFRAGVADRLGLGYDELVKVNPQVIMAALSGFGAYGPRSRWVTYGMHVSNLSGLMTSLGYDDTDPVQDWVEMPDPSGGVAGASAVLAALHYRLRTGKGQHIDLSEEETAIGFQPEKLMDYAMNGREAERMGNRAPGMAPHGVYRCAGDDEWVSVAVGSEEEWERLCSAIGKAELARDTRFRTLAARKENEGCPGRDSRVVDTGPHSKWEVMKSLQGSGVGAVATFTNADLYHDEHLAARGFFTWDEHPVQGRAKMPAQPWRMSGTPLSMTRPGPKMGEHNGYVLEELLGLSSGRRLRGWWGEGWCIRGLRLSGSAQRGYRRLGRAFGRRQTRPAFGEACPCSCRRLFLLVGAISGDREDLELRRSESVARRTPRTSAALVTLSPKSSMISVRMKSPGWEGVILTLIGLVFISGSPPDSDDISHQLLLQM